MTIAACSGGGGDSAFPCTLLETDELEAALGEPLSDGDDSETGGIQFCSWEIEDGNGRVRIGVLDVPDADALLDMGTNTEEIDDLGDRAQVGPAGNVAVAVGEVAGWITPRLGGVGPTTRAMLLRNCVSAARRRAG